LQNSVYNVSNRQTSISLYYWFNRQVKKLHRARYCARDINKTHGQRPSAFSELHTSSFCGKPRCASRSPDLSPIEHVWDILERRNYARNDGNNVRLHCWRNGSTFHWSRSTNWSNSIGKRCTAVIDKNGYHTRYWGLCDI